MAPATTPQELIEELAPICRHHGIKRIRVGDIEIEFGTADVDPTKLKEFQRSLDQGVPTDDEVLNWSAPGFVPPEQPGPVNPTARVSRSSRRK